MNTIKLHKDYLKNELDLPAEAIKDTIESQSRWTTTHEIIFAYDGKFWRTWYTEGSTEQQDQSPWEYETEIECTEVHIVEKIVKTWEPV